MDDGEKLPPNGCRLNGWKEIAAHFGKGVRTVQRWEKAFGLPIHRIGAGNGEIVYAFTTELDCWQVESEARRASEQKPADVSANAEAAQEPMSAREPTADATMDAGAIESPRRSRWRNVAVAAACIGVLGLVIIVSLVWLGGRSTAGDQPLARDARLSNPHHLAVVDGKLRAYSVENRRLWDAAFDPPLAPSALNEIDRSISSQKRSVVHDLDGDGRCEVLFARTDEPRDLRLYAFNADGSLRFARALGRDVQFGDTLYRAPFIVTGVFLTSSSAKATSIWAVGIHSLEFPSVLARLDAHGTVVSEYWSNGHITHVARTEMRGKPAILVGACNNEVRGGSLAVFDEMNVSGAAPAEKDHYTCHSCGSGRPGAFFVFRPSHLASELGAQTPVIDSGHAGIVITITLSQAGGIVVPPDPQSLWAVRVYSFDENLSPLDADINDAYAAAQQRLERLGRVTAASRPAADSALFPVLSWAGDRFVPLKPRQSSR